MITNPLLDAAKAFVEARPVPDGMDLRDWALRYERCFQELRRQVAVAEIATSSRLAQQQALFRGEPMRVS